jgi:hypothetical protein
MKPCFVSSATFFQVPLSFRIVLTLFLLSGVACAGDDSTPPAAESYTVDIVPADFTAVVDNPYYPLTPGTRYVYEGETEEGQERIEIEVLSETKEVMGVETTIVRDTAYLNGEVIEDTFDWFAQDRAGNVWYFGEDTKEYEAGEVVSAAGSWEAGVDGALPGIVMYANPAEHIGEMYRQEYYEGEAEDMGQLVSATERVTIPFGSFENVVQTLDTTPLEPDVREHKFYAPGVGLIQEVNLENGETVVLVEMVTP